MIEEYFSIKLEDKIYHIYESYILNGTGYTFRIYKSSKMCQERDNCFIIDIHNSKIIIIGKKYNYLLIKEELFSFSITKYKKNVLKFIIDGKMNCGIYLEDEKLVSYYADDDLLKMIKSETEIINRNLRFEKLKKINNINE